MAKCSRCKKMTDIDGDVIVCSDCLRKEILDLREKLESNLSGCQKEMFKDFCNLIGVQFM